MEYKERIWKLLETDQKELCYKVPDKHDISLKGNLKASWKDEVKEAVDEKNAYNRIIIAKTINDRVYYYVYKYKDSCKECNQSSLGTVKMKVAKKMKNTFNGKVFWGELSKDGETRNLQQSEPN